MSDLAVNDAPVLRGDVLLPRVGSWTADLTLDAETAPTGSVTIASPAGLRLVGTAERSRAVEGRVEVRVRGGAGGLLRELAPVAYRPVGGVRVRTILEDWARESGESLSSAIAPELLAEFLPAWTRERGTAERAVRTLARALGCSWRFHPDGGLLLVRETWPTVDPDGITVLRDDPVNDAIELGVDVPLPELVPGVTWQGRRVSSVEAFIIGNGTHRVRLLFENATTATDRDRCAIKYNAPRTAETDDRAFSRTYLARVVAQSTDLSTVDVELEPDVAPERRAMPGLVRVPLYGATPGAVLNANPLGPPDRQVFCLVTFINGDRAKPCVLAWLGAANNNTVSPPRMIRVRGDEIQLGESGARKVARDGDPIRITIASGDLVLAVSGASASNVDPITLEGTIADGSPTVKTD